MSAQSGIFFFVFSGVFFLEKKKSARVLPACVVSFWSFLVLVGRLLSHGVYMCMCLFYTVCVCDIALEHPSDNLLFRPLVFGRGFLLVFTAAAAAAAAVYRYVLTPWHDTNSNRQPTDEQPYRRQTVSLTGWLIWLPAGLTERLAYHLTWLLLVAIAVCRPAWLHVCLNWLTVSLTWVGCLTGSLDF